MKMWVKILIAFLGSGTIGALTFASGQMAEWATVFTYVNLAIGGAMSLLIGWPPKEVKPPEA